MDTSSVAKKYQKASTVCCSANVLLFLAYQCAFFGRIFFSANLARIFSSGSQNLEKIPGNYLAPFEISPCLSHTHIYPQLLFIGTLPGIVIKLISEGKANFDGCEGPFTLPTDLSSIKDIEKIDLSSLGGRLQGSTIPSGTFFCFWRTTWCPEFSLGIF